MSGQEIVHGPPTWPVESARGFCKTGEREIARTRVFTMVKGEFTSPDGLPFSRDLIRHHGAVAVVPLGAGDRTVFLVHQYRPAIDQWLLELPAGVRDVKGESLEVCASRELAEEIGMEATSMEPLCSFFNAPGYSDEEIHVFLARGLRPVGTDRQGVEEEHMTIHEVALEDVPRLIAEGRMTDVKTLVGLLMARERSQP